MKESVSEWVELEWVELEWVELEWVELEWAAWVAAWMPKQPVHSQCPRRKCWWCNWMGGFGYRPGMR